MPGMGYFARNDHGCGPGRDPRKLPGNPLVSLKWWRMTDSKFFSKKYRRFIKEFKIDICKGWWVLDNKIRGHGKVKSCKVFVGFNPYYKFIDEDASETEIESESDSDPVMVRLVDSLLHMTVADDDDRPTMM